MPPTSSSRVVRFGVYELDLRASELRKDGVLLRLQGQPFQILAVLLERPGEIVTRDELRQKLWPADTFVDFDNSVNAAINRLRETLGDSADNPRFVQTLPRRGYRFIAPAEIVEPNRSQTNHADPPKPLPRRRLWAAGIAVCAALLSTGLYHWKGSNRPQAATAKIRSIAVLPLTNVPADSSQDFFSDGMTEALITNLAQIRALRVTPRTSSMRYKGTGMSLQQIGRELNVDGVVEGTVVRAGGRVRIDAQLLETTSDRHLWAGSYERTLEDVLALQAEVAESIAREIRIEITPQENASLKMPRPVNKDVYENYLRGRFFWNKRTDASTQKSIEYFESALRRDPKYAPALSGISDAYALLGFYGTIPPRQAYPDARAAATHALQIDDKLAEAHVSLGEASFWFDWKWPDAESEFKRAIELNPRDETAYRKYSNFLAARGRHQEALARARQALECDPVSATLTTHLGWIMFLSGQDEAAIEQYRKTIDLDPYYARARRDLAMALAHHGNTAEAIREGRKAIEISKPTPIMQVALGYAYARAGQTAQLHEILRQLEQQRAHGYVSPFYEALLYAAAGQKDRAFIWLEKAYQERSPQLAWLGVYPPFDELHSDPRFKQFLLRVEMSSQNQ